MLYGLLTFLLRLKKIKRKDPLGYDDPVGPVLLVIVLCGFRLRVSLYQDLQILLRDRLSCWPLLGRRPRRRMR